jgi:hypothetical protein
MLAARERAVAANEALQDAVDRARDAGRSWREIGDVLGTTRQAAVQRFGHPADPRTGTPRPLGDWLVPAAELVAYLHEGEAEQVEAGPVFW